MQHNLQSLIRRDTPAWKFQVWAAFGLSALASAVGIWNLDAESSTKLLMGMGFLFSLFTALSLSKTVRDNQRKSVDTEAWRLMIWVAFGVAFLMTGWSLFWSGLPGWPRAFMGLAWIFLQSSAFTLAKSLRDEQEAGQADEILRQQG
jgi:hypothetical protein